MAPEIIAAIILSGGGIITTAMILFNKRRSKVSNKVTFETSSEYANDIKKISKKISLPSDLVVNPVVLNERINDLNNKILSAPDFDKISPLDQNPELFAAYAQARSIYAKWGNKINLDLLVRILIERLKAFNQNDEIYYDQALKKLDLLTSNQLKFLTLHHVTIGLLNYLIQQDPKLLPDLQKLKEYLNSEICIGQLDIDHLISAGLITDQSPYQYPNNLQQNKESESLSELKILLVEKIKDLNGISIWSYNLSPVCKIISSLNIKELLNSHEIGFIYPVRELADFYVKNLYATEDVTGFFTKNDQQQA